MSITIYDVECDHCEMGFAIDDVFNVEYANGMSNVLCAECATVAEENDDVENVWQ